MSKCFWFRLKELSVGNGSGRIVLLLGLILLWGWAGPCLGDEIGAKPGEPSPAEAEYRKGVKALGKHDLAEAQASFNKSLELDPKQVGASLGLAEVAIAKGDPKAAEQPLQRALAIAPGDAKVQTTWGHYLFWQKRYTQSEAAFKKAIALDPHLVRPRVELADLYLLGLRQPKAAIESYRGALAIEPQNVQAHFMLAQALVQSGEFDKAQHELEEAVRLDPKNPSFLQVLGDFQAKRRQTDQALETYARAISLEPKFVPAYMARGDLFLARGELDKARADFEAASKIQPKLASPYVSIGMVEQRRQKIKEAEQAYRTAIELDPKQAVAYNNLAWLAAENKTHMDEAVTWASKAVELSPESATFQDTLGWVYHARGQNDKALSTLQKASALGPREAEIFYHLGVVYADTGQAAQAKEALQKALAMGGEFEGVANARAKLAALGGTH